MEKRQRNHLAIILVKSDQRHSRGRVSQESRVESRVESREQNETGQGNDCHPVGHNIASPSDSDIHNTEDTTVNGRERL